MPSPCGKVQFISSTIYKPHRWPYFSSLSCTSGFCAPRQSRETAEIIGTYSLGLTMSPERADSLTVRGTTEDGSGRHTNVFCDYSSLPGSALHPQGEVCMTTAGIGLGQWGQDMLFSLLSGICDISTMYKGGALLKARKSARWTGKSSALLATSVGCRHAQRHPADGAAEQLQKRGEQRAESRAVPLASC